jgi:hypothetical protein
MSGALWGTSPLPPGGHTTWTTKRAVASSARLRSPQRVAVLHGAAAVWPSHHHVEIHLL